MFIEIRTLCSAKLYTMVVNPQELQVKNETQSSSWLLSGKCQNWNIISYIGTFIQNTEYLLTLNPLLFSNGLSPVTSSSLDQSRMTSCTIWLFRSTNLKDVMLAPPYLNSSRSNKSKSCRKQEWYELTLKGMHLKHRWNTQNTSRIAGHILKY